MAGERPRAVRGLVGTGSGVQRAEQVRGLKEGWWGDSGEAVRGRMMNAPVGHTGRATGSHEGHF